MGFISAPLGQDVLRALFENTDVALLVANKQGTYVQANEAAARLLDVDREDIIGRSLADFIDPAQLQATAAQWAGFLQGGSQSGTFELRTLQGEVRRVRFFATANFFPGLHSSFLFPEESAVPV